MHTSLKFRWWQINQNCPRPRKHNGQGLEGISVLGSPEVPRYLAMCITCKGLFPALTGCSTISKYSAGAIRDIAIHLLDATQRYTQLADHHGHDNFTNEWEQDSSVRWNAPLGFNIGTQITTHKCGPNCWEYYWFLVGFKRPSNAFAKLQDSLRGRWMLAYCTAVLHRCWSKCGAAR